MTTQQNLPVSRDTRPPVPATANVAHVYPLSPPPPASLADAARVVQRALDIFTRFGDELQEAMRQPYPCAICNIDTSRWLDWQRRRHFLSHPVRERARVLGWVRAVMPS